MGHRPGGPQRFSSQAEGPDPTARLAIGSVCVCARAPSKLSEYAGWYLQVLMGWLVVHPLGWG